MIIRWYKVQLAKIRGVYYNTRIIIRCFLGFHDQIKPIVAAVGENLAYIQCGLQCLHCKKYEVSIEEVGGLIKYVHGEAVYTTNNYRNLLERGYIKK